MTLTVDTVKICGNGFFRLPSLLCNRSGKKWIIAICSVRNEVVTEFNGKKWTKKFDSTREALLVAVDRWFLKAANSFHLADIPSEISAVPLTGEIANGFQSGEYDFPVSIHPIVRDQINYHGKLNECCLMWYENGEAHVRASPAPWTTPLLMHTDMGLDPQAYEDACELTSRYPKWIWFFRIKTSNEIVILNAMQRGTSPHPWSYRRHVIEMACDKSPFLTRGISVVAEDRDDMEAHLLFYKNTPRVLGVDILAMSCPTVNGEFVQRIMFKEP